MKYVIFVVLFMLIRINFNEQRKMNNEIFNKKNEGLENI